MVRGSTRLVFLIGRHAVKLPRMDEWRLFLSGLLANMQERVWGKSGLDGICPVSFADPLGFIVIMRRARNLTAVEWDNFNVDEFLDRPDYVIPAEAKRDSFGVLDGHIVAIDYGS